MYQLLHEDFNIVRSPKSYNSQIGVPLSVWQAGEEHSLGIFEAGISQNGEMEALQELINPTIGILTNLGEAHNEGFANPEEKLTEKWKLFKNASTIICNADTLLLVPAIAVDKRIKSWGRKGSFLKITAINKKAPFTSIDGLHKGIKISITIPFTDNASIENAISCWCTLLHLKISTETIATRMDLLRTVEMRLQLKRAINNCSVINDSYSNDISSLEIALDFLQQQAGNQSSSVILSDLGESTSSVAYDRVAQMVAFSRAQKFIGIGPQMQLYADHFSKQISRCYFYSTVEDFKQHFSFNKFKDEVILLKGARTFQFEQIDLLFEQQMHQTVLEVNLTAMVQNLKEYQRYVKPETKIMAMVKAFSYGSGSAEVASVLQFHKVDYLAVAYADEGVELRKSGISMPIMVMNPEVVTFQALVDYNLEPELYSFEILKAFDAYLLEEGMKQFPVHIKLDTGMHRLGFEKDDVNKLATLLKNNDRFIIKSVFSHLVASDDPTHDSFTRQQVSLFEAACQQFEIAIRYPFLKHVSNSAAIFRHPVFQFNMVRLGIGLYGVDSSALGTLNLTPVATFKTTIAQIRKVKAGESIGYSRKGILEKDSTIATIRVGYADGFSRRLGNWKGQVFIKGQLVPVIGNVCMDMTMIDITGIEDAKEGDLVELFGPNLPVQQVAAWCDTIPYEIMTSVSHRVKRVYYEE
ncbi:MAG: bifunctional UDP-N-acetylmuramoyl-tripeptide:D-alanyl-D-alanine ligase/alanine racemase [Segetibacter sp.]|nr:bifunctional UDP-N-acetylmuramoyl-tripeptide:D-alanyl-D-alanine ligase/alanine racemase [Segetibacter sp.]